jgi:hypothetical protein
MSFFAYIEVHNDGLLPVAGDPAATDNNGAEGRRRPPPVTTLSLAGNQLPDVPPAIGRLARVRRLDLSRNQITYACNNIYFNLSIASFSDPCRLTHSTNCLTSVDWI